MNRNVRNYVVVTAGYWAFTLTDGALRMLVLLYLYDFGYSPLQIASLFLFYEFFGVVTNLFGGYLGARFGLKSTLFSGLALQIIALSMLGYDEARLTVPYVMAAQALSGIAKDLTKMSSKSYIKLVVPGGDQTSLLKWIALLTGSKNTLKGVGFFLGGFLLSRIGFERSVLGLAGMLAVALIVTMVLLPGAAGKAGTRITLGLVFSGNAKVKWLSLARFFLFGSRDVWFVLALPIFRERVVVWHLTEVGVLDALARFFLFGSRDVWFVLALPIFLSSVLGWNHTEVGVFLALWIVGYGIVQALAPTYVGRSGKSGRTPPGSQSLTVWTSLLVVPLAGIIGALTSGLDPSGAVIIGLVLFGIIFAANSAIHSYLIIAYAQGDTVALNVGFYYMANAAGRLVGTALSGAVFQVAGGGTTGLIACLLAATGFVLLSVIANFPLQRLESARVKP